ncbi:acetate--CoA ligase family protein [Roseomonas sp. NAR14]|uniref:Acetate--CoA ligase family protein n=1 Tax=Roseomonas acroporae TaxID=2937791 RepID=A0A9X2BVH2_9PROT|nr:acetate--CoA ligase [Roseomonas acroporae]MCK8786673.1 acetate--CoA ligase family protein [Roseomonas acroporae]
MGIDTSLDGAPDGALDEALFNPRSVALIGATADQAKNNSRVQRLLARAGYAGRIVPVNPGRAEVMGVPAFPDIRAAPGPIDHAFVMVPAAAVPDAIAGCAEKDVRVATIYSAGFAELGEAGRALQERVVAVARAGRVRLLGPNCLGLVNVTDGVPLTINAAVEAEALAPGWLGVVSQSGSMMGALLSRAAARGLGFSRLVSVGNECDLGVGEIAGMLVEDPATRVVLLFLETLRDAPALARAARRAHALGKAVVAYKLGRSDVGRRIAASHTGAMVGADELAATFFRENGILRVETLDGLMELPRLALGRRPPAGNRVSVLTGTGGGAAMVVDRLGLLGDQVVPPPPAMRAELAARGIELSDSPLIDLPMGGGRGQYTTVLTALQRSDHCDAVVAVLGSTARLRPAQVQENILSVYEGGKPVVMFAAPQADAALRLCDEAGIAGFRTPEACADALHAWLNWRAPREVATAPPERLRAAAALLRQAGGHDTPRREGGDSLPRREGGDTLPRREGGDTLPRRESGDTLDEAEACAVFEALGIEGPGSRIVGGPDEVGAVEGPVAAKLLSPDILHKTENGLVRLNLAGAEAVRAAVRDLLATARDRFPAARVRGVLVAPMQRGLLEVILGYRHDPEVGPVVVLGLGGVLAELRRSFVVRLAPVDAATAREMVAALPELRVLDGYRNLPRGDVAALARAVEAMSWLACLGGATVRDAEINPLIVRGEGEGVVAVDGLIALGEAAREEGATP